jgi:hypothetical protein
MAGGFFFLFFCTFLLLKVRMGMKSVIQTFMGFLICEFGFVGDWVVTACVYL